MKPPTDWAFREMASGKWLSQPKLTFRCCDLEMPLPSKLTLALENVLRYAVRWLLTGNYSSIAPNSQISFITIELWHFGFEFALINVD